MYYLYIIQYNVYNMFYKHIILKSNKIFLGHPGGPSKISREVVASSASDRPPFRSRGPRNGARSGSARKGAGSGRFLAQLSGLG